MVTTKRLITSQVQVLDRKGQALPLKWGLARKLMFHKRKH